ncbi:MAG: YicC family protein [Lachnospiraceae bacterium]|nr:YicC family protein [Lachnospiraceae bacterium]
MIKSMTGFGRFEKTTDDYRISVEIKSVNHRYCDIGIKMPKKLLAFEGQVRTLLKDYIERGKVDVYISYEDYNSSNIAVKYNKDIAKGFFDSIKAIGSDFDISSDINAAMLSRYPEVIVLEEQSVDTDVIFERIEEAVKEAAVRFVELRMAEGANLKKDILLKLDNISEYVDYIVERSPQVVAEYREKIYNKVNELLGNTGVDESILATEITVYADKVCVDEEMVRLKNHIDNMRNVLELDESIGRKLDFIAQELNREANTTLSKSNDIDVSNKAIDLKTEIEKIREQIQNIE